MRITKVHIEQLRNVADASIDFGDTNKHLLLGQNGAGKTNILEAVSLLSLTKSFLGSDEADVVQWETDFYRVRGEFESDALTKSTVEVTSQVNPRKQKGCFMNDVRKTVSEVIGHVPTVSFLPQDLELFTGSPAARRRFMDELLCQVSPEYLRSLLQYQKILKQRNALLKKIAEGMPHYRDLKQWDTMLSEAASHIILARFELLEVLQCTLAQELCSLGESWEEAEIQYKSKITEREQEKIRDEFKSLLLHYQERDLLLQTTSLGPHRDDWEIMIGEHVLQSFASRGQQRTALLALLFLKVSFLELRRGEKPIILLDDVFSELDDAHQDALIHSFDTYQIIMTATHTPPDIQNVCVWNVKDGVVRMDTVQF